MKRAARLAQWMVVGTGILLLFWVAAAVGGWSPEIRKLTSSVRGVSVGDYRAENPQVLAPLLPAVTKDAAQDQAGAGHDVSTPRPSPSGGPSPNVSGTGPAPTGSAVLPTLPVATPTLPVATPTVPVATPTLPRPPPLPTPTLPTPPPLP